MLLFLSLCPSFLSPLEALLLPIAHGTSRELEKEYLGILCFRDLSTFLIHKSSVSFIIDILYFISLSMV